MEDIIIKVDIPSELKKEFKFALTKVTEQFVKNLKLSMINDLSEISQKDNREIKASVVKKVISSTRKTFDEFKSEKMRTVTPKELDVLLGLK